MELTRTRKYFYILLGLSMVFLLTLGSWWLYLVSKLGNQLSMLNQSVDHNTLISMIKWEGLSFLILALVITGAIFYIFMLDSRKTQALQSFFASITHELKTPLASINLQSQVLQDYIDTNVTDKLLKESLNKYTNRLHKDCFKLEAELNRHLELSRVQRKGSLPLENIDLLQVINQEASKLNISIVLTNIKDELIVKGHASACSMIFKNLFENSKKHNKNLKVVELTLLLNNNVIKLQYNDHGQAFEGNVRSLSNLFYKFDSPKGSGIGLYLIKKMMNQMHGRLGIHSNESLYFDLIFKKGSIDE